VSVTSRGYSISGSVDIVATTLFDMVYDEVKLLATKVDLKLLVMTVPSDCR